MPMMRVHRWWYFNVRNRRFNEITSRITDDQWREPPKKVNMKITSFLFLDGGGGGGA